MNERVSEDRLREILAGCEGVAPGPWKIGRMGNKDMTHVVDFGEPPKAPFAALHEGTAAKPGFTGFSAGAVAHSDDDSSPANAAHIARLDPGTVAAIVTELLALRQQQEAAGWRVKALEWEEDKATTPVGVYSIIRTPDGYQANWGDEELAHVGFNSVGAFESVKDCAKQYAQADYASRISSSIEPASGDGVREALKKLRNEVSGLEAFERDVRAAIGNTNWSVLQLRLKEADEALASSPAYHEEEPVAEEVLLERACRTLMTKIYNRGHSGLDRECVLCQAYIAADRLLALETDGALSAEVLAWDRAANARGK